MSLAYYVHPSAYVDEPCTIGAGTKIWHFCHVMPGARLGERCILGQNVHIANDVVIGNNVKIQNNVSVYTGVELEDGVTIGRYAFIGAGAVVRHDVPDYALMLGVPAVQKGWMSRHGHRLPAPDMRGMLVCPESDWRYQEVTPGMLRCLDWPEERSLPPQEER